MWGITLRASGEAEAFWQRVDEAAAFEATSSIRALGYAPHLTLARFDAIDPEPLMKSLDVFAGAAPVTLTFDQIATFDADPLVLWLKPRPDARLLDLHTRLHAALAGIDGDGHYGPGDWQPHCTIASAVMPEHRAAALDFARQPVEPITMTLDVADALQWPPVTRLASRELR